MGLIIFQLKLNMQIVFFYWPFWIYRFIKLLRKYLMAFQTITEVFRNFGEDGRYDRSTPAWKIL